MNLTIAIFLYVSTGVTPQVGILECYHQVPGSHLHLCKTPPLPVCAVPLLHNHPGLGATPHQNIYE